MKQSSARGERINAIVVGGMHKRNHKPQVKVREVYAFFAVKTQ